MLPGRGTWRLLILISNLQGYGVRIIHSLSEYPKLAAQGHCWTFLSGGTDDNPVATENQRALLAANGDLPLRLARSNAQAKGSLALIGHLCQE
jgi:hypothetical protein